MAWNMGLLGAVSPELVTGAYDLLETTTLTSSASSVTFSGLGSYTDYKHLQIRMVIDSISDISVLFITLNSLIQKRAHADCHYINETLMMNARSD